MSVLELKLHPSPRELRVFAAGLLGLSLIFAGLFTWNETWNLWKQLLILLGALISLAGLLIPRAILIIYQVWMIAVYPVGWFVSHLILVIVFYGIFTPIGLLLRLVGSDPIQKNRDPEATTYWSERPPPRPNQDYFRQF